MVTYGPVYNKIVSINMATRRNRQNQQRRNRKSRRYRKGGVLGSLFRRMGLSGAESSTAAAIAIKKLYMDGNLMSPGERTKIEDKVDEILAKDYGIGGKQNIVKRLQELERERNRDDDNEVNLWPAIVYVQGKIVEK